MNNSSIPNDLYADAIWIMVVVLSFMSLLICGGFKIYDKCYKEKDEFISMYVDHSIVI